MTELTCQSFVEQVTEYLETTLPTGPRAACEAHLAGCDSCRAYLEQMRQTVLLLGKLIDDTVEPAAREALLRRFRDGQER
jgi:anti-sigma factor RsiW